MWGTVGGGLSPVAETMARQLLLRCPYMLKNPNVLALTQSSMQGEDATSNLKKMAARCPVMSAQQTASEALAASASAAAPAPGTATAAPAPAPTQEKCPVMHGMQQDLPPMMVADAKATGQCPVMHVNNPHVTNPHASSGAAAHSLLQQHHQHHLFPTSHHYQHQHQHQQPASADLFNYSNFVGSELQKKKQDGSYRVFQTVIRKCDAPSKVHTNSKNEFSSLDKALYDPLKPNVTVWCSNDYLGMSQHPKVLQAASQCLSRHGMGAGGTRNISGNGIYHELLEQELASLHQKERALVFSSGYVANDATLATLGARLPGCVFFSDASNHASMIEGIVRSRAKKFVFRHNDPHHLEELLKQTDPKAPKIVAFESVYSMCGSIAPIGLLCDIAHRYGALTFLDEVHAVGLYGRHGGGVAEQMNLLQKVDLVSGTLGKAFGCFGGYVAGRADIIDYVRSFAPGFIFTTSLPPVVAAAATASIQHLKQDNELRIVHKAKVAEVKRRLRAARLPVMQTESHIVPLLVGDADKARALSRLLLEKHQIYVQAINYPTVARGAERLRITPGPLHSEAMIEHLLFALQASWAEMGLPLVPETSLPSSLLHAEDVAPLPQQTAVRPPAIAV